MGSQLRAARLVQGTARHGGVMRPLLSLLLSLSFIALAVSSDPTTSAPTSPPLDFSDIPDLLQMVKDGTPLSEEQKAQVKAFVAQGMSAQALLDADASLTETTTPEPEEDPSVVQTLTILHVCSSNPQLAASRVGVDLFVNEANAKGGIRFGKKGITYNFAVEHYQPAFPNMTVVAQMMNAKPYDFLVNCHPGYTHALSALTEPRHMLQIESSTPLEQEYVRPGTKDKYKYKFGTLPPIGGLGTMFVRLAKQNGCNKLAIVWSTYFGSNNKAVADGAREAAKVVNLPVVLDEVMNHTEIFGDKWPTVYNVTQLLVDMSPVYGVPTFQRLLASKAECFLGAFVTLYEPTIFDFLIRKSKADFQAVYYAVAPSVSQWQRITAYNKTMPDGSKSLQPGANYLYSATFWAPNVPYTCPLFGSAANYTRKIIPAIIAANQSYIPPVASSMSYILTGGTAAPLYVWQGMKAISDSVDKWKRNDPVFTSQLARAISDLTGENMFGPIKFNLVGQNTAPPVIVMQTFNYSLQVVSPPELKTKDAVWPAPVWQARDGCPIGSYNNGQRCILCPLQSYSNTIDAPSCTLCPVGYGHDTSLPPGQTQCGMCPAGQYSPTPGAGCSKCKVGFEQPNNGSDLCVPCLPGSFAPSEGTTKCSKCAEGTFAEESGAAKCLQCAPGHYRSNDLEPTKCYRCLANTYQALSGQSSCEACPAGMVTTETGSDGLDQCVCQSGKFWDRKTYTCKDCGLGTECDWNKYVTVGIDLGRRRLESRTAYTRPEGFVTWPQSEQKAYLKKLYTAQELPAGLSLPEIKYGFYSEKIKRKDIAEFSEPEVWKCQLALFCPGGTMVYNTPEQEKEADDPDFDVAGSLCSNGFSDVGCARCRSGWGQDGQYCVKCNNTSSAGPLVFTPIVLILIAPILYLFFNIKESSNLYDTLSIGLIATQLLSFIQGINVFSSLNVSWQAMLYDIADAFSFLKFDFSFLTSGCSLPSSEEQYFMTLFFPIFVSIAVLVVYAFSHLVVKTACYKSWAARANEAYEAEDKMSPDLLALKRQRQFSGCCGRVRRFFAYVRRRCASGPMTFDRMFNTVGYVINAFYVSVCVNCFIPLHTYDHPNGAKTLVRFPHIETGTEQWNKMMAMGAVGLFVYIGVWMSYMAYCVYYAPEKTAKTPGFLIRFGFLIPNFRPDVWWWGLLMVVRSLILSIIPLLGENDGQIQTTLVALVLAVFCCAHMRVWPFKSWVNNVLDCSLCMVLLLVGAAGMWYGERRQASEFFFDGYIIFMLSVAIFALVAGFIFAFRESLPFFRNKVDNDAMDLSFEMFSYMNKMGRLTQDEVYKIMLSLVPHDRNLIKNCFQLFAQEFLLLGNKDVIMLDGISIASGTQPPSRSGSETPRGSEGRRSSVLMGASRRIVMSQMSVPAKNRSMYASAAVAPMPPTADNANGVMTPDNQPNATGVSPMGRIAPKAAGAQRPEVIVVAPCSNGVSVDDDSGSNTLSGNAKTPAVNVAKATGGAKLTGVGEMRETGKANDGETANAKGGVKYINVQASKTSSDTDAKLDNFFAGGKGVEGDNIDVDDDAYDRDVPNQTQRVSNSPDTWEFSKH